MLRWWTKHHHSGVLRLWQTHKNNFTKSFEEEFEYVSTCQHCQKQCKMHFCFILKIFAFRGVHSKIFCFIFGFILWSFFCQTSKVIQKWSQKWAKNYSKMATINNPNAVQVTQFIDATISNPVTPQTIRNVLKESGFDSGTKKNSVCKEDPQVEGVRVCTLSWKLDCGRPAKEYYSQIRPILIELGLIKRWMCGRRKENQYLTELLL